MTSFFGSGPLPDWNEIKRWLGKDIPWELAEKWEKAGDGEWLERFIQRLLKEQPAEQTAERTAEKTGPIVRIDTVKNAKHVSVSVKIPPGAAMRDLRLLANSDRLKVTGLLGGRTQVIRFPCRVVPRSGRAEVKGGRIVVHFRRRPVEEDDVELFIRP